MREPASKEVLLELSLSCQMGEGPSRDTNTAQRPGCLGSSQNPGEPICVDPSLRRAAGEKRLGG